MLVRSFLALAASAALSIGASLKPVTSFGSNPTSLQMYLYVPDKVAANPSIIVAVSDDSSRRMPKANVRT